MKILLLGATGQIGHALLQVLARSEHQVSVMTRRHSGERFPSNVSVRVEPNFTVQAFRTALDDVDHVIYSIGLPEQFMFDTAAFQEANCRVLTSFLEAVRDSRVRAVTYLSTYEVFEVVQGVIRESHAVADERHMTPYSQSKVRAYRQVKAFADETGIDLTTIHPAAVYGGLNTGAGITDYMLNLALWKWYRVPTINAGNFPVIHVDSLADLILRSLGRPGAYIASDQMTSLKAIAQAMRRQERTYVPIVMPLPLVRLGARLMEALATVAPVKPLISSVQIDFLTRGWAPDPAKAIAELGWKPMPLDDGIARVLSRPTDLAVEAVASAQAA